MLWRYSRTGVQHSHLADRLSYNIFSINIPVSGTCRQCFLVLVMETEFVVDMESVLMFKQPLESNMLMFFFLAALMYKL